MPNDALRAHNNLNATPLEHRSSLLEGIVSLLLRSLAEDSSLSRDNAISRVCRSNDQTRPTNEPDIAALNS